MHAWIFRGGDGATATIPSQMKFQFSFKALQRVANCSLTSLSQHPQSKHQLKWCCPPTPVPSWLHLPSNPSQHKSRKWDHTMSELTMSCKFLFTAWSEIIKLFPSPASFQSLLDAIKCEIYKRTPRESASLSGTPLIFHFFIFIELSDDVNFCDFD